MPEEPSVWITVTDGQRQAMSEQSAFARVLCVGLRVRVRWERDSKYALLTLFSQEVPDNGPLQYSLWLEYNDEPGISRPVVKRRGHMLQVDFFIGGGPVGFDPADRKKLLHLVKMLVDD